MQQISDIEWIPAHILRYPQVPIIGKGKYLPSNDLPSGMNAIAAIGSYWI